MAKLKDGGGDNGVRRRVRGMATIAGLTLVGAAVVRELRLPPEKRTWHGTVFGRIPYDLRFPSVHRIVHTVWDPANRRVMVPTAFGVGWSVNVAALLAPVLGHGR
jgi:hypothetical protein